jgi:tetratricopeptide repeat protein 21B
LKRAGKLNDIPKFLERAEKAAERSSMAGLAFAKGLYHKHIGEPQNALRELNIARFDSYFGEASLSNMIEIYLNPLNEMIYCSTDESAYNTTADNIKAA